MFNSLQYQNVNIIALYEVYKWLQFLSYKMNTDARIMDHTK